MTFEDFTLHARVAAGVRRAGYTTPTPIQERALPGALAGRDVLGLAQTGTGKTAAFALPLLNRLIDGPRRRVRALVVAPTRELAEQIHDEITLLGSETGLRSATVYGGVGMQPQVKALRGGAEIIVACPGRLLDHLSRGVGSLTGVEILVLDEADHMFDMGFLPDVRRIVRAVPESAQRMLFSATMPDALRPLANEVLTDPVIVEIGRSKPVETVAHTLYPVSNDRKTDLLEHLLRDTDTRSALVFTRTKHRAKRLAEKLDKMNFFATSLQGNLSQSKRQKALDGFKDGSYHVLVATDIAARGIDVSRVSHVINYDLPDTPEAYTHRIGRTGRAERTGEAFTFVTREDARQLSAIERELGEPIERVRLAGFDDPVAATDGARGVGGRAPTGRGAAGGGMGRPSTGPSQGSGTGRPGSPGRSRRGGRGRGSGGGRGAGSRRGNDGGNRS